MSAPLQRLAAATALWAMLAAPAAADQKDPRLGPLFERLHATANEGEAATIEAKIWAIWAECPNPAANAVMELGLLTLARGDVAGAFTLFDAVTQQAPDFAEGWNKRATALYLAGQYEASASDVDKTLKLEPRHFGALAGLGLIRLAEERYDAAEAAFVKALEVNPHLPAVRTHLETIRKRKAKGNI